MKHFVLLSVVVAAVAASVIKDPNEGFKDGGRYINFPGDGDGQVHLVDTQEPADEDFIRKYTRNPENNAYFLRTRSNPHIYQTIVIYDTKSVEESLFHSGKETVILAHGWNGNGDNDMNKMLSDAFLVNGDVNVISLDWSRLANRNYATAKGGTAAVGRGLGHFVQWLVVSGFTSYERVHLVGFSLGGHLVGNAARECGSLVQRVTALDPAGPLWTYDNDRIVRGDARYVEVFHTNTGHSGLGYTDPCGDGDFYPNGGSNMPGCITNGCDHGMAYEYYSASVKYNHMFARECETMREMSRDRCTGTYVPMGNADINKLLNGIYRGNTQRNYPFYTL